jgi:hypothetical protein
MCLPTKYHGRVADLRACSTLKCTCTHTCATHLQTSNWPSKDVYAPQNLQFFIHSGCQILVDSPVTRQSFPCD